MRTKETVLYNHLEKYNIPSNSFINMHLFGMEWADEISEKIIEIEDSERLRNMMNEFTEINRAALKINASIAFNIISGAKYKPFIEYLLRLYREIGFAYCLISFNENGLKKATQEQIGKYKLYIEYGLNLCNEIDELAIKQNDATEEFIKRFKNYTESGPSNPTLIKI